MDGRGRDALRGPTRVKGTYVSEALDAVSGRQGQFLGRLDATPVGLSFLVPPVVLPELAPSWRLLPADPNPIRLIGHDEENSIFTNSFRRHVGLEPRGSLSAGRGQSDPAGLR